MLFAIAKDANGKPIAALCAPDVPGHEQEVEIEPGEEGQGVLGQLHEGPEEIAAGESTWRDC
jgi:hypothetical protein